MAPRSSSVGSRPTSSDKETSRGRALAQAALELARSLELGWVEATSVGALGYAHRADGELEEAWEIVRRSVELAAQSGFRWWQAGQLTEVMELGLELGRLEEAEQAGREALRLATTMEDRRYTLWALTGLAVTEHERGNLERSGRVCGAVAEEDERAPVPSEGFRDLARPLAEAMDPQFLAGTEQGREDGLEAAVALALGEE